MDTVKITVRFGKENLIFNQKIISVAEENRLRQRFLGLDEKELEEKAFNLNVSVLSDYEAEEMEKISFDEKGAEIKSRISIKEYFSQQTAAKQRIAEFAVRGFLVALQPNVDF